MDNDQKWKSHFCGKGGLLSSLNQRLFMVKRISNHISKNKLRKVVDSLWTSKLRYGLQLCSEVRLTEEHPKSLYMTMAQRSQNKMLRILDGALVSDRKSTKTLLDNQNMLSVNQIAAQIKLTEMWKASDDPQYPIKMKTRERQENSIETRSLTLGDLTEVERSTRAKKSLMCHAAEVWNKGPGKNTQNFQKERNLEDKKAYIELLQKKNINRDDPVYSNIYMEQIQLETS